MSSRPVQITQVYPQDTAPTDKRDGVLWVDTSVSPPKTKTWDADTTQWAPVATSNVDVQNTAPSAPDNGDIWVDTSLSRPRAKVYDSAASQWNKQIDATEFGNHKATSDAHHARPTSTANAGANGGYFTITASNQTRDVDALADQANLSNNSSYAADYEIRAEGGTLLASGNLSSGGSTTHTWSTEQVDSVWSSSNFSSGEITFEIHEITLPTHSHSI